MNKLVNQYNNTYHHSVNKKSINADYSAFIEKNETHPKAPKVKIELELPSIKIFLIVKDPS